MEKHLGHISVDAGLCWIGDPCYVLPSDADKNPGYGDGSYPVTATIKNGRVLSVTVKFG